jgi:hypothetical protein
MSSEYKHKNTLISVKVDTESNVSSFEFSVQPITHTSMSQITMLLMICADLYYCDSIESPAIDKACDFC